MAKTIELGGQENGYDERVKVTANGDVVRLEFFNDMPDGWFSDILPEKAVRLAEALLKYARKAKESA